ncbi:MAG: hypothetical protein FWC04_06110 [Chitinispirillia bacterium]|nr:hypothetical protein [Chitinispirillia bacterium]
MKALYRLALVSALTAVLLVWDYADSRGAKGLDIAVSAPEAAPVAHVPVVLGPVQP